MRPACVFEKAESSLFAPPTALSGRPRLRHSGPLLRRFRLPPKPASMLAKKNTSRSVTLKRPAYGLLPPSLRPGVIQTMPYA